MAKISQTISGGSGGGGIVAPVKVPTSGSPLAQGIGQALNVGIGLFAEQRAKEKAERQNAALASVHTDFLDAQDDAINQQQEAQAIQNQISIFHEDGDVSSDEMKMMAGLREQLDKFDLLSPSQRQIRKNALLRQALNDPANAGIQSTISSMFGGINIEPVQNPAQAAFEQKMDQMYGVGAWTPEDAGREQGKAIYLQNAQRKASTNFKGAIEDIQIASSAASSGILQRVQNLRNTQGFITADQAAELRLAAAGTRAELYSQLTEAAKANGAGLDPADLVEAKQQVDAYFSMFTDLVTGEGNITDEFGINKQMKQLNDLTSETIKYESPFVMKAATSVLGSGSVGGGQSLLDMLQMLNNKTNITLLESSGADPALMTKQATSILEYVFGGTEEKVDTIVKQAGNSRLINFLAGNVVLNNVNTPDEAGRVIEVVGQSVEAGASVEDAVEALTSAPSAVNLAAQGELQESAVAIFKKGIGSTKIGEGTLQRLTIKDNQLVIGTQLENILANDPRGTSAKADDIRKALEPINRLLADFPTKINAADLRSSYLSTLQEQRGEPIDPRIVNVEQLEAAERGEVVFDDKIGSEVLGELPPRGGETPVPATIQQQADSLLENVAMPPAAPEAAAPTGELTDADVADALDTPASPVSNTTVLGRQLQRHESPDPDAWWGQLSPFVENLRNSSDPALRQLAIGDPSKSLVKDVVKAAEAAKDELKEDNYERARNISPELEAWVKRSSLATVTDVFGPNATRTVTINGQSSDNIDYDYLIPSTAVGKYQILAEGHMSRWIEQGKIRGDAIMSEETQDKMAALLMEETPALRAYIESDAPTFAQRRAARRALSTNTGGLWEGFNRLGIAERDAILEELRNGLYDSMIGNN